MAGIHLDEIDSFLEKTTLVHNTIRAIADGTIEDDNNISLKEHGILTLEEQAEEEALKIQLKLEKEARKAEHDCRKKEEERSKWWAGAVVLYGAREDSDHTVEQPHCEVRSTIPDLLYCVDEYTT